MALSIRSLVNSLLDPTSSKLQLYGSIANCDNELHGKTRATQSSTHARSMIPQTTPLSFTKRTRPTTPIHVELLEGRIAPATLIWDGSAADQNWFTPANWDGNAVPGVNDLAILNINSTISLTADVIVGAFQQTSGTLTGPEDLTIIGNLMWSGGSMEGAGKTSAGGSASSISGTLSKTLSRQLENSGALTISTGDSNGVIFFGVGGSAAGVLSNLASGTVNVTAGGDFSQGTANPSHAISNAGTWNVASGGATSTVGLGVVFSNTGTVNVVSGRFLLNGGGTSAGGFALTNGASLEFGGGTFAANGGSLFSGAGTVGVSGGTWNFTAGNYNVGNTLISGGDADFSANATTGLLTITNGTLLGSATVNVGNLAWTFGSMEGSGKTVLTGAGSTISGASAKTLARELENNGTLTISTPDSGGAVFFGAGPGVPGILTNTSTGTVNVTAGGDFSQGAANPSHAINNLGTWNNSGGGGTSRVALGVAFNNMNMVNIASGRLELNGGTNSGTFGQVAGATLEFAGGTYTAGIGSVFNGVGTVEIGGATWNFTAGTYNVANTVISSGDANFSAAATTGMLTITNGTLLGSATVNATNLAWSGGSMEGTGRTVLSGAGSTISGASAKTLARELENNGTLTISTPDSGGVVFFGVGVGVPGILTNTSSGTVNVTTGGDFLQATINPAHAINNLGTWNNSGGGGTSRVATGVAFNNMNMVNVASGRLELNGGTNSGTFTQSAGAILEFANGNYAAGTGSVFTGAGTVEIGGAAWNFTAGTYNVANTVISSGDANFAAAATTGLLTITNGTLLGPATVNATNLSWSGGTMEGSGKTVLTGAGSTISGAASKTLARELENNGTLTISTPDSGGAIFFGVGVGVPGILTNTSGGTVNVTTGGDFLQSTTNPAHAINNLGTWNNSGGGGTSRVATGVAFNNMNMVNVVSGRLELNGGTNSGTFTQAAGAILEFASGNYAAGTGSVFTGAGTVEIGGAAWNFTAGTYNVANTVISSGNANFSATATTGLLTITNGTLLGSATVNATNLSWSGGTMEGSGKTVLTGAGSTISGVASKTLARELENNGTLTISTPDSGGGIFFGVGVGVPGILTNTSGGTVNVTTGGDFLQSTTNPAHAINNLGTWNNSGGGGTSRVATGVAFNNMNMVNIASGRLELNGGTNTGTFTQGAGSTLEFASGTYTANTGSVFNGAGTVEISGGSWTFAAGTYNAANTLVSGGTADFSAAATTGTLTLSNGTLLGSATLSVTGNLSWTAGTMAGTGKTTIAGAASTVSGAAAKTLGRQLENSGTLTFSGPNAGGGVFLGMGAEAGILTNLATGTVNVTLGSDFSQSTSNPGNRIDNGGTWNSSGAGTTSIVGAGIGFNNAGTVNVPSGTLTFNGGFSQTAGATQLTGGSVSTSVGLTLNGGVLSGAGSITGNVTNSGAIVQPGGGAVGVFTITGNYTQNGTGSLAVEVGGTTAGTQYDQVSVSGTAAIGGSLTATLINGFTPAAGNVFNIVVATSRTGTFATVNAGAMLGAAYTPTQAQLIVDDGIMGRNLSIDDVTIIEGDIGTKIARFTVSLSIPSFLTISVQYATANAIAIAPEDYAALGLTTLTFLPNEVSKVVDVTISGDEMVEGAETFFVNLSNPSNAAITDAQGLGTIQNDDVLRTLGISNASVLEGSTGTVTAQFTVTLSLASLQTVSVQYATANGTASSDDYTPMALSTLTFAPGVVSQPIVVTINADSLVEATELFSVVLSNAANATIGIGTGFGIIRADDFLRLGSGTLSFPEPDGDIVTINLGGGSLSPENIVVADDGSIASIDLSGLATAAQAAGGKALNLSVGVKTPSGSGGDGMTKVGLLNSTGLNLGKVKLTSDLGRFIAGDINSSKPSIKSLTLAGALGSVNNGIGGLTAGAAEGGPTTNKSLSEVFGSLGKLIVGGNFNAARLEVGENVGSITIRGAVLGSQLFAGGEIKSVKVIGAMTSTSVDDPNIFTARNKLGKLVVDGNVESAQILIGYDKLGNPVNPDAILGKLLVKGDWSASSLAVGVADSTGDGFGRNDTVIAPDPTPGVFSKIASIVIKGTAEGSKTSNDSFGFTAQKIGKLSINGLAVQLDKNLPDDLLLDNLNGDLRIVEIP